LAPTLKRLPYLPSDNTQSLGYAIITLLSASYEEVRTTITDRNAGYDGLKLEEGKFL
jgi:hypothetical protein